MIIRRLCLHQFFQEAWNKSLLDQYISDKAIFKKERQTWLASKVSQVARLAEPSIYALSKFSYFWELNFFIKTYLSFHLEKNEFIWKCSISVTAFLQMRREKFRAFPVVKSTSSATVAMSGTSLIFSVQCFHDLSRKIKFHRWASIWKMFCKALDKVIFMYCIAMCGNDMRLS